MTRIIANILKMEGVSELPIFNHQSDTQKLMLDFNKIIPIPYEVLYKQDDTSDPLLNELAIESLLRAIDKKYDILEPMDSLKINELDYINALSSYGNFSQDKLINFGAHLVKDIILYKDENMHDWCEEHWGTERNSYNTLLRNDSEVLFHTASFPPHEIIKKLSEMYPDKLIEHHWADESCESCGCAEYSFGTLVTRDYYSIRNDDALDCYELCWGRTFSI